MRLIRPIQTRFRFGFASRLNLATYTKSPLHDARGTQSGCFRRSIALLLLVGTRFQVLLTPLTGVLFTFPSRYWFTIGQQVVFRLTRWSSQIRTGFHVSRPTRVPNQEIFKPSLTGLSPSSACLSRHFCWPSDRSLLGLSRDIPIGPHDPDGLGPSV